MLRLGSLFSGSGGFELAGLLQGILPVWCSEIEPYPIAVTTSRFPNIKHLGNVKFVDGSKIEPVDIITFGSPCQNLSIAGNQKGLEGEQSSLFYEAIRIIKEMRNATDGLYPRIAVWENVPGAFSSNKGEDFRAVLQEFVNICEPSAVVPKVPKAGWAYYDCWYGDRWSIAYRTFDAQYWGVPQRRRRIYLVADFRGRCAKEILFKQDSLRGYFEKGRTPWQEIATNATRSFRANDCRAKIAIDNKAITFEPGILKREGGHIYEDVAGTVRANAGDNQLSTAYGITVKGNGEAFVSKEIHATLTTDGGQPGQGYPCVIQKEQVACGYDGYNQCLTGEVSKTITSGRNDTHNIPCVVVDAPQNPIVCMATQQGGAEVRDDNKAPTLTAAAGMSGNNQPVICFHLLQDPISSDKVSPCVSCGNSESGQAALGIAYVMVENHPADSRIDIDDSGTCQTLTGRMGTGGGNVPMVMHVDIGDNSSCRVDKQIAYSYNIGDRYGVPNEHIEKCPTLTARCGTGGNNVPAVMSVDMGGGKSVCVSHEEVSPTLTCTHYGAPAVAYLVNGEKVVGTLSASQGDKMFLGNQEAFSGAYHIVECTIDKNEQCFCIGNGQADQTYLQDKAGTLNCMHDQQCVLKAIALDRATFNAGKTQQGFEISETVNAPLVATGPSAVAYRNIKYIVRRITPVECARLQGFPDKWGVPSKKTDFTDEEYKFWLSVRQNFAQINNKQSLDWNKQSMLNWYNKLHTDSAEYKMWGNGVALPTTLYVMQGIRMVYEKESSDSL